MSTSIYDIPVRKITGAEASLAEFKGKVLLVVNVASKCGLTKQYEGLEKLYEQFQDRGLVVSTASPTDRRATLNQITPEGQATLDAVMPAVDKAQERTLAPLNQAERAVFSMLLAKIADANNMLSRAPQRAPRR